MSNTYQLTAEIHQLIDQINQKTGKELRVESDTFYYVNRHGEVATEYYYYGSKMGDDDTFTFNPENIQRLLCELDLGENSGYRIFIEQCTAISRIEPFSDNMLASDVLKHWRLYDDNYRDYLSPSDVNLYHPVKTQAKALSDKWFSLQERDGKAAPSLWNSGEEGQIQVLTELKEVLENYLNN